MADITLSVTPPAALRSRGVSCAVPAASRSNAVPTAAAAAGGGSNASTTVSSMIRSTYTPRRK
ncbi:hypothetical protein BJF90_12145 [Pseudonocardia sp. CNS-004]|nr:hypothetical protein BJF90_12145 [Pseudonocardia sp. CNS-004]